MKKIVQSSTLFLFTFYKSVLLLSAILIATLTTKATTDTIPATLQSPVNFGGCIDTVFTFTYFNTGTYGHYLKITAKLINNNIECAAGSGNPLIMANNYTSTYVSYSSTSATGDTLIYYVDSLANIVTIKYHVRIDCTNLNQSGNSNPIQLSQTFTDSSNGYWFNINSTGINTTLKNISVLKIIPNNANLSFYYHTNDTAYFQFTYSNISFIDAHIRFNFSVSDDELCSSGTTHSYEYSLDSVNYTAFLPNTYTPIVVSAQSNLYIRQAATQVHCLPNPPCMPNAFFSYQCDFSGSGFCSACYKID